MSFFISGVDMPVSHCDTAALVTPHNSPNMLWLSLYLRRNWMSLGPIFILAVQISLLKSYLPIVK